MLVMGCSRWDVLFSSADRERMSGWSAGATAGWWKEFVQQKRAIKPWAVHLTPLSVVSTDGKENNLTAWNCITADLRPDTITQPSALRKAARAATCKSQFPHRILKILETPQGAGRWLLPRVHTEPPAVVYSGLDSVWAPAVANREEKKTV